MYFRSQLEGMLVREFGADDDMAADAIDAFFKKIQKAGSNYPSVILSDDDETIVEGDLEEDAEHVYSTQEYWKPADVVEPGDTPLGVEDVELPELPYRDKLDDEDLT